MPTLDDCLEEAKIEALKELAYGASHEINNPLANIAARAQTLLRDEIDPERRRALEAIHQQALRAHEMIADLMLFARPPQLALEAVDLASVLSELQAELVGECERRQITLQIDAANQLPFVWADREQLAVAIGALCRNSVEAIGQGGAIDVTAAANDEGSHVELRVHDDGPGVDAGQRPHIFEPFYSGREAGRGLGFGLSKCWRIVDAHGGRLDVDSSPGSGATFTIRLPAADSTPKNS